MAEGKLPERIYLNPLNCQWGDKYWAGTVTSERANSIQVEYVNASRLKEAEEKISALQQEVEGGSWAYVKRIDDLEHKNGKRFSATDEYLYQKKIEELGERERKLREALEWYADVDNYVGAFSHDGCATSADENCGLRAREALAAAPASDKDCNNVAEKAAVHYVDWVRMGEDIDEQDCFESFLAGWNAAVSNILTKRQDTAIIPEIPGE